MSMSPAPDSPAASASREDPPHFRLEPQGDDAVVFRITRPAKLNAITKQVLMALSACLDDMERKGQRLLVVTAEGERAFCAGTDLAETQQMPPDARQDKSAMARALLVRLSRSKVLSVAAINGLAYGGGLELAMACTFRVAAPHVKVSLPEIKLGILPAYAGTQFLPALVGSARALDMMLTGRPVPAQEALSMGLVNRVTAPGADVLTEAIALGREAVQFSPDAIAGIRECVAAAGAEVTDDGLAVEDRVVRAVGKTDNAREGVAAFLEKRPAVFR
jgi:enoyl-CoA hydratase